MNDATHAQFQKEELEAELSECDEECLRRDLNKLGLLGWLDWACENQHEANDYLQATQKQRARKKKWQDPTLRRRLCLLAILQADIAKSTLAATDKLAYRGQKRSLVALAASLGIGLVLEISMRRWPFHSVQPPKRWEPPYIEPVLTVFRST